MRIVWRLGLATRDEPDDGRRAAERMSGRYGAVEKPDVDDVRAHHCRYGDIGVERAAADLDRTRTLHAQVQMKGL